MRPYIIIVMLLAFVVTSCASMEEATDKVKEEIDGRLTQQDTTDSTSDGQEVNTARAKASSIYDFKAGDTIVFQSDFSDVPVGNMPETWKSNGTGQVVTFPGVQGKWLLLKESTSYKLDSLMAMPENFTLEFDILTRSDQAEDIGSFSFGFARDNSVDSYISDAYNDNAITETEIHYHNNDVNNSSSDTEIHNSQDFELAGYANAIMHVAVEVQGQNMKVYLDKTKVLDTEMFDPGTKKYFYLSPAFDIDNEAQIAISNFIVGK